MLDALVFVGRFQPFHLGHKAVLEQALSKARHVIIVLGSDGAARNTRNPFTSAERAKMISESFDAETNKRIHYLPQRDFTYNLDRWYVSVRSGVTAMVTSIFGFRDKSDAIKIGITGHMKDETSFYVKGFQGWEVVEADHHMLLNATDIRNSYFNREPGFTYFHHKIDEKIPDGTAKFLKEFYKTETYTNLCDEHKFIQAYKKDWSVAPYPPTFVTADAVVVQNACVLLVKRRDNPGKGLWALPGGFVNQKESIRDAAIRELKEETKIKLYKDQIIPYIEKSEIFDDPWRSLRGRTVTTAFLIKFKDGRELPEVKGSDDAEEAKWIPLDQLDRSKMFDDHFEIAEKLLGI